MTVSASTPTVTANEITRFEQFKAAPGRFVNWSLEHTIGKPSEEDQCTVFKVAKAVFYFFAAVALAIPAAIHSAYTWAFSKPSEQAPLPVNAPADRGWWPFRSK